MPDQITHEAPIRRVTDGPASHFFGYYEKTPWDATGRFLLALEVDCEGRPNTADDVARVCLIDLDVDNPLQVVGETRAWCWQQGCMLRWLPSHPKDRIIHNARDGARLMSVVADVRTGDTYRLPLPVYAVSPDGRWAVTTNFARINRTRPGYGYRGVPDPTEGDLCPADDGVVWMDLRSGEHRMIATFAEIAALAPNPAADGAEQWVNHLQINPDGSRIAVLHRWRTPGTSGLNTRLVTMNPDGSDPLLVVGGPAFSHYDWFDTDHILAWSRHPDAEADSFVLITDGSGEMDVVAPRLLTKNGHCSFSPDRRWLLTDTYPDADRQQTLILYRWPDGPRVDIGRFYLSPELTGEFRCDLHPRWNRDGTQVCIDSAHEGTRQVYVLDVSEIVGG